MSERTCWIIIYAFIASLLLGIFYVFFGGQIINDLKADRIKKNMSGMTLPADTELVEVTSFVGNTSGTSNHVEIWAGVLIHTDLTKDTLCDHFEDYDVLTVPDDLEYLPFVTFQSPTDKDAADGYFVVGKYFDAFTQMDLRGH